MASTQITGKQIKDGSVDLAVDAMGVLPLANGGTGAATAAGALTGLGIDLFVPLSQSEVAINTTATFAPGKMHVCSGAGGYAVTLPAAANNAGKIIAVRMSAALTGLVSVAGNGSEQIDGQNTRPMWAQESAILLCDGTGWTKIAGKTIALSAKFLRTTALSIAGGGVIVGIPPTSFEFGPALMQNAQGISVPRAGRYSITGQVFYSNASQVGLYQTRVHKNSIADANTITAPGVRLSVGDYNGAPAPVVATLVAGDILLLAGAQTSTAAQQVLFSPPVTWLSATEIPSW